MKQVTCKAQAMPSLPPFEARVIGKFPRSARSYPCDRHPACIEYSPSLCVNVLPWQPSDLTPCVQICGEARVHEAIP